jgi:hypothetical protein
MCGRPTGVEPRCRGRKAGLLATTFELIPARGAPTSIPVGARKLKRKMERARGHEESLQWIAMASFCFRIALSQMLPVDKQRAIDVIAKCLGDQRFLSLIN